MTHTPQDIETKAAQVRQLLTKAVAALDDPAVLEAVILYALGRPEIEWEPVAVAACALDAKRERDEAKPAAPMVGTVSLPSDPEAAPAAGRGGVSLPSPPWGFV